MICYLGVTTGVVINFHYCMEKLASAKLFDTKSKKCGKCGMHMEDSDGCCRDEVKIVKMKKINRLRLISPIPFRQSRRLPTKLLNLSLPLFIMVPYQDTIKIILHLYYQRRIPT